MPDPLDHDLSRLAPEVDLAASRDLFERRRARRRRAGRIRFAAVAAALVLVLGIGVTAVVASGRDTTLDVGGETGGGPGTSVPTTLADSGPVEFEVLAMEQATEPMGTLRAAVDPAELGALWTGIKIPGDLPPVDLTRWVVVSMTIPDDACPPTLTGFDGDGSVLTPVFVEPEGGCIEPLIPKTFVVAIARSSVEPRFTLRLPGWDSVSDPYGEQRLDVEVPPLGDPTAGADPGTPPSTTSTTWSVAPTPSTSPPAADGELLAAVPLPPAGEARSSVLVDGTPIWVVHHPDGTASALPAVVVGADLVGDVDGYPRGLSSFAYWRPGGQLVGQGTWDAWGRAIDDGMGVAADLTGFAAEVEGDQVIVRRSSAGAPPGDPVATSGPLGDPQPPTVPRLLPDPTVALPTGWVQLDLDLVADADGDVRLCAVASPAGGGPPPACPAGSRSVPGLTTTPGVGVVVDGPLLVRSDGTGQVTAVAVLGAGASIYPTP